MYKYEQSGRTPFFENVPKLYVGPNGTSDRVTVCPCLSSFTNIYIYTQGAAK